MNQTALDVADAGVPALSALADQINEHHREVEAALNSGLEHALAAGRLLLQAKAAMPHGQWGEWIAVNCRFSDRTARGYMRIAARWPELLAKWQRAADLSAREAIRLLSRLAESKGENSGDGTALPELRPDTVWTAAGVNDLLEIWPAVDAPGYYRVAHYRDLDTDNADVVYDRRGVRYTPEILQTALVRVHRFEAVTDWSPEPFDGKEPWFATAPGVPDRMI